MRRDAGWGGIFGVASGANVLVEPRTLARIGVATGGHNRYQDWAKRSGIDPSAVSARRAQR